MISDSQHEDVLMMLRELDDMEGDLTDWEMKFIADLIDREPDHFTERQAEKIRQIYEEKA